MFYHYECEGCRSVTEVRCPISEMKREIKCPNCGKISRKIMEAPALVGVSSTKAAINKEIAEMNKAAGKRMRGSHRSMKTGK